MEIGCRARTNTAVPVDCPVYIPESQTSAFDRVKLAGFFLKNSITRGEAQCTHDSEQYNIYCQNWEVKEEASSVPNTKEIQNSNLLYPG